MNRLIIIGNGFDLAHGLRTSYYHFITSYLAECMNKLINDARYEDPLLSLIKDPYSSYHFSQNVPKSITPQNAFDVFQALQDSPMYNVEIHSPLLKRTMHSASTFNWVDLENEYFDELISCRNPKDGVFNNEGVEFVNAQFQFIKEKLEQYLLEAQFDLKNFNKDPEIDKIFRSKIEKDDLLVANAPESPKQMMYLTFNYTNTLEKYTTKRVLTSDGIYITRKENVNHIHGQLGVLANPIVFGFGDEYDKNYVDFEEMKNNKVFTHIKSFAYLKTTNHLNLTRFLNKDKFQVLIIGHSCGLSDRTMFRKIFEHDNCLSIKIFYYQKEDGTNDFTDKTYDIARHFTDKGKMRDKIVSEPLSKPFPQYNSKFLIKRS